MNWWRCISALPLIFVVLAAHPETITFEIYALPKGEPPQLLAKGIKTYTSSDIKSTEYPLAGAQYWAKTLQLNEEFYIGGSIYREPKLGGFGLWVKRRPGPFEFWSTGGFSWEWFDYRQQNDVYRKLQGTGRVKVTMLRGSGYEEIGSVEFLDDVTMRLNDQPWFTFSLEKTHHVIIRKGSVLRFAP